MIHLFSFLFLTVRTYSHLQAFKTGDAEMVKMILNHKSAEEDMLLSQSSLSKDKQSETESAAAAAAGGEAADPAPGTDDDGSAKVEAGGGGNGGGTAEEPSITHELGFGVGVAGDGDEETGGVRFLVRELPIRNPDECFGDDAREDTTGLNLWSAAVVLGRWVASPEMQGRLVGQSVLELGAGCGAA